MPQETKPDVEKPGEVHTSLHQARSHWRMSVFRRLENVSYYVGRCFFLGALMPQETKPDVEKPGEVHTSLHQARSHWRMSVFRRLENVSYHVDTSFFRRALMPQETKPDVLEQVVEEPEKAHSSLQLVISDEGFFALFVYGMSIYNIYIYIYVSVS